MNQIIKFLGTIALTAVIFSIPILTALSFAYDVDSFLQFVLIMLSIVEAGCLFSTIWSHGDD